MQRRTFLQGCCAAIVAMSGARVGNWVFAADGASPRASRDIVISVFLRGGMDALSFLVPYDDTNYHTARSVLGLDGGQVLPISGTQFGLHPAAPHIRDLIVSNHFGVVCACGSPDSTRSHFLAQDYMERGKPGDRAFDGGGWIARHLATTPEQDAFKAVARGSSVPVALEGYLGALAMSDASSFSINGDSNQAAYLHRAMKTMYANDPLLGVTVARTLDAVDVVDANDPGDYTPPNGVVYPNTDFANSMKGLAQLIRLDLGLQAATVDFGGWDTHVFQADGSNPANGDFANLVGQLSAGLDAFWRDLSAWHGRLTVVVMSEFGRRLKENEDRGTDHGNAGTMMVLSSNLARGGVFGTWPGLAEDQLFDRNDLQVTTDFRTVLAEILIARLGNTHLGTMFPGFTYPGPVGLFGSAGELPPVPSGILVR